MKLKYLVSLRDTTSFGPQKTEKQKYGPQKTTTRVQPAITYYYYALYIILCILYASSLVNNVITSYL